MSAATGALIAGRPRTPKRQGAVTSGPNIGVRRNAGWHSHVWPSCDERAGGGST